MDAFCDGCGDITVIWVPLEVRFPDGSRLTINLCLDCWKQLQESRKHKVARILKLLLDE